MAKTLIFDKVKYWLDNYGLSGAPDDKAIENFIECETEEMIQSLRGQLNTIKKGEFDEERLQAQLGLKRKAKHGSFEDWAKLMLLWLSAHKGS